MVLHGLLDIPYVVRQAKDAITNGASHAGDKAAEAKDKVAGEVGRLTDSVTPSDSKEPKGKPLCSGVVVTTRLR